MRPVVIWLFTGLLLVYLMVIIGGITRLTHSGLSMVEWNVILGTPPPLNDAQWQETFEKYKQFPEYKEINYDFTLHDFKTIFWWEYIHRLLGRIIGIVFLVPFIYFFIRKKISGALLNNLIIIFLLGALQGLLGWLMVKSGLADIPRVSHYRLAAHLITAMGLMGYILWVALEVSGSKFSAKSGSAYSGKVQSSPYPASRIPPARGGSAFGGKPETRNFKRSIIIILSLLILQVIYGAFTAGLRAGFIYNTFPKMGDEWIAGSVLYAFQQQGFLSLFENPATVQFIHRCLGIALAVAVLFTWLYSRKASILPVTRNSIVILALLVIVQVLSGIVTLLLAVPVSFAVLHQATAMLVFANVIYCIHNLKQ